MGARTADLGLNSRAKMIASRVSTSPVSAGVGFGFLERTYGLDLRSLSLFRIGLGALILGDLIWRAQDLRAFYTDFGVLPRAVLLREWGDRWVILSVHLLSGTALVQGMLFLLAMGFGVMVLVGYRTNLATIASWVLLISLQNRTPIILTNGDLLLRMLLFWAMFLPLNSHFSLDRTLDTRGAEIPQRVFTIGSVSLMAQIAFVYGFGVILKSGPEWRTDASAVYYALSLEQFATPVGRFLLQFPCLLRSLTVLTLAIETLAPILLFCPFMAGPVRTASIFLMMALQVGLLISMHLGHFPLVAVVTVIGLLPTWVWSQGLGRSVWWPIARMLHRTPMRMFTDRVYEWMGTHRSLLARLTRPLRRRPLELRTHWVAGALAAFFLCYVFWWNLGTVSPPLAMPDPYRWIGEATRTQQRWNMFAPSPLRDDGWFVMPGVLRNGKQVDVFRDGAPVSFAKPSAGAIAAQYKNARWRKYLMSLYLAVDSDYPIYYGRYLCRKWNEGRAANDPARLDTLEIYFMMRTNVSWTQTPKAYEKHLLHSDDCR